MIYFALMKMKNISLDNTTWKAGNSSNLIKHIIHKRIWNLLKNKVRKEKKTKLSSSYWRINFRTFKKHKCNYFSKASWIMNNVYTMRVYWSNRNEWIYWRLKDDFGKVINTEWEMSEKLKECRLNRLAVMGLR